MLKTAVHLLAGALFACLALSATAQSQNPLQDWRTLDSEHFHVHFEAANLTNARAAAAIAEQQYARLTRAFDWYPAHRIQVSLVDNNDLPQGVANVVPFTRSEILLVPPDEGELVSSDDWMTLVLSHELAHVIHLDKSRGLPNSLQKIFGRHPWLFPARMQPTWGIEGLAVYWESQVNPQGRATGPWFEMLMRLEVANGLKPLAQINSPAYGWPRNQAYLYGSYFHLFLADVYGEDTIFRLVSEYGDNLVPYRLVSNSARVTGKPLPQLWQQFEGWLTERFQSQLAALQAHTMSSFDDVTPRGFAASNALVGEDGTLWFVENDGHSAPVVTREKAGKRERIVGVQASARLALHPQQGLLIAQPERCDAFSVYYDLFKLDADNQLVRLTHCGRYRHAVWSPDGSSIAAVRHIAGKPALVLLDASGQWRETLFDAHAGDIISALDWHGDTIAIVQQHNMQWDIHAFNVTTKTWQQLTHDSAIERDLHFSHDSSLLYSADYSGNFDLYRLTQDRQHTERLTRGIGAAIAPGGMDRNGYIYYTGFAADGQHIRRSKVQVLETVALASSGATAHADGTDNASPVASTAASGFQTSSYSAWKSIAPTSWQPYWQTSDDTEAYGVTVFGQDALSLHQYLLSLARETDLVEYAGVVSYGFANQLFLTTRREIESVNSSNPNVEYYKTELESQVLYSYPFGTLDDLWHAGVGYSFETDKLKTRDGTVSEIDENVVALHFGYSSVKFFPQLYGASAGRSIALVLESYDAVHNNDFTGEVFSLDWHEYIPVGDNTLALRWVEGIGSEQPTYFELGDVFSEFEGLAPHINQRKYALRGYDSLDELSDRHLRLGTIEWRMPLRNLNRSLMVPPIGVGRSALVLFSDTGTTWHSGSKPDRYYSSAGVEIIGELVLGYNLVLDTRVGFARGFADIGESQFYMRFGRAF